jgi:hypothetical protein
MDVIDMHFNTRNLPWLTALGALVGVAVFSGALAAVPALALLAAYGVTVVLSSVRVEVTPTQLIEASTNAISAAQVRATPEAREAAERARRRGGAARDVILTDIGLIATQSGRDGIAMRRTRDASSDDDGIRPYMIFRVPPRDADRSARVRFEIIDQTGTVRYVHEMRTLLRDGETSVLADHHLPLENAEFAPGEWELRASVDGMMVGMYSFQIIPSTRDRLAYLRGDRTARPRSAVRDVSDPSLPVNLEELLRGASASENHRDKLH